MDAALTAPHGPIWYGASVPVVDDEAVRRLFNVKVFLLERAAEDLTDGR